MVFGGGGWDLTWIFPVLTAHAFLAQVHLWKAHGRSSAGGGCQKAHTYWLREAGWTQLRDKCRNLSGQVSKWDIEKESYLHVLKNT